MGFDALTLECLVEAVASVYEGKTPLTSVGLKHPGVDRRRVSALITELSTEDEDLELGVEGGEALRRAIWNRMPAGGGKQRPNNLVGEEEFSEGVWQFVSSNRTGPGKVSAAAIEKKYGVKRTTLYDRSVKLKASLGHGCTSDATFARFCQENEAAVKSEIEDRFGKKALGRKPILDDIEVHVIAKIAHSLDDAGMGLDKHRVKELTGRVLTAKGEGLMKDATTEEQRYEAKRYLEAKLSKGFMRDNFGSNKRHEDILESDSRKKAYHKISNISQKRAAAASPILSSIMTKKFKKYVMDLHLEGKQCLFEANVKRKVMETLLNNAQLTGKLEDPVPRADQCFSGDEIGLPPNGPSL
jgi:hypothetical protein